jgi:hypothetical protein
MFYSNPALSILESILEKLKSYLHYTFMIKFIERKNLSCQGDQQWEPTGQIPRGKLWTDGSVHTLHHVNNVPHLNSTESHERYSGGGSSGYIRHLFGKNYKSLVLTESSAKIKYTTNMPKAKLLIRNFSLFNQGPLARGWKAIPLQYSTYILYFILIFTVVMLLIARYVSRYGNSTSCYWCRLISIIVLMLLVTSCKVV